MTRYGRLLAGLILYCTVPTFGQEQAGLDSSRLSILFDTAFMHVTGGQSTNASGLNLGGQYHLSSWLAYTGQAWVAFGSGYSIHNYLVGPEVTIRKRVAPFAHILVGLAHSSQNGRGDDTSFSVAIGGGVVLKPESRISFKVAQIDYAPTYFRNGRQDNIRFSTGFVIRL
jgi:hypothetical protein